MSRRHPEAFGSAAVIRGSLVVRPEPRPTTRPGPSRWASLRARLRRLHAELMFRTLAWRRPARNGLLELLGPIAIGIGLALVVLAWLGHALDVHGYRWRPDRPAPAVAPAPAPAPKPEAVASDEADRPGQAGGDFGVSENDLLEQDRDWDPDPPPTVGDVARGFILEVLEGASAAARALATGLCCVAVMIVLLFHFAPLLAILIVMFGYHVLQQAADGAEYRVRRAPCHANANRLS